MMRARDVSGALLGGFRSIFSGLRLQVQELRSRDWSSATFAGARHELTIRIEGNGACQAADQFVTGLGAWDFSLRGHLVADIGLVAEERRDHEDAVTLTVEVLTVESD